MNKKNKLAKVDKDRVENLIYHDWSINEIAKRIECSRNIILEYLKSEDRIPWEKK
jgi:predicted DNA-binding protein YlxM (UPF0122 family)